MLAFASIIVVILQLVEAANLRLRVEGVRQETAASVVAGPASGASARLGASADAIGSRWPRGPAVSSGGTCEDGFPPTGVEGLDRTLTALQVRVEATGGFRGYGSPFSVAESLCAGAGTARRSDVGGDLVDADPGFWGAAAREQLEMLYN